ncbi:hypothetical protein FISHEDRAFT_38760, partial [Fistulina hepatica ATCC 64428]
LGKFKFQKVVENLEGLIIQCLFVLAKANLAGTGICLQHHIFHAISNCSKAIHMMLDKYNVLAPIQKSLC